ncbi:transducin beta-like protein 2 isoform X3 [Abrus precatorius]|uniref:Transducin beta-like protein 2 isoform X3 n=1 Tax=Abrus precatorius TaxID=3816 RepID=A0A8B8M427_ABRPR|nr:transducin beta-like protein 2 isoform X3 [Abrus precatorius]
MDPLLPIVALSLVLGAIIALVFFNTYFRNRKSEIRSIANPNLNPNPHSVPNPKPPPKKPLSKPHSSDKDQIKRHHPLDLNTLKGHGDAVTGLCFSPDGRNLATEKPKTSENKPQAKLPLPEIKWERHKVHDKKAILTLFGTSATYGSADGSTIIASCSEGTDIILWHGKTGKNVGHVDTNQLKNTMATISPNGRFVAAAAFTADVKVWEIVYAKDGSVKEVAKVMQLKGHKSAVTWLCFTPNSEQIITASKDGSMRIWNINVRYHLDEDPKTLKVLPIPLHDSTGTTLHYDRLSISPNGKILAATHGSTLQWLCAETGKVLDTAEKAHDSDIACISWAPKTIPMGNEQVLVLATASADKKVKLWASPSLPPS